MRILFFLLIFFPCFSVQSQISILSATVTEYTVSAATATRISVYAVGSEGIMVQVRASVKDRHGQPVFDVLSEQVPLKNGTQQLAPMSFVYRNYAASELGNSLRTSGILPFGQYEYCVEVIADEIEVLDVYCDNLVSTFEEFLSLIYPGNGDSVVTTTPTLIWNHTGVFGSGDGEKYYHLVLTEKLPGQSAEEALLNNPVLWSRKYLTSHNIPYPVSAPKLKEGATYVWQVLAVYNGAIIQTSEVWVFSIGIPVKGSDIKYINVRRGMYPGIFDAYESLFLRFDEPYNIGSLRVEITDKSGNTFIPALAEDKESGQELRGSNLLRIDIQPLVSGEDVYTVWISDGHNARYELKFRKK